MGSNPTFLDSYLLNASYELKNWEKIVYILIIIVSFIFNIICLTVVARSSVFHFNVQTLMWLCLFLWFEFISGTLILIYAQNEIESWLEKNCKLILVSAVTHYHFIFTTMISPLIITLERGIASIFILDYEKKQRKWVILLLFGIQHLFSIGMTILIIVNHLRYLHGTFIGILISFLSLRMFLYLDKYNKRRIRFFNIYHSKWKYNLSARYQLLEIAKTFKMMWHLFRVVFTMIILACILKTLPWFFEFPQDVKIFSRRILDMAIHAAPIYFTCILVLAVEDYHAVLRRMLGNQKMRKTLPVETITKSQTDIYFEQFNKAINSSF